MWLAATRLGLVADHYLEFLQYVPVCRPSHPRGHHEELAKGNCQSKRSVRMSSTQVCAIHHFRFCVDTHAARQWNLLVQWQGFMGPIVQRLCICMLTAEPPTGSKSEVSAPKQSSDTVGKVLLPYRHGTVLKGKPTATKLLGANAFCEMLDHVIWVRQAEEKLVWKKW